MPEFEVTNEFIDAATGERRFPGDTVEATGSRAEKLKDKGLIGKPITQKESETATKETVGEERITFDDLEQKPGGYYYYQGELVGHGKEEAKQALAEMNGGE